MKRMTARRGLVALATVLGLLALSSSPASAGAPADIVGTVTIGGDEIFEVGGGDPHPCASDTLDVAFTSTSATTGTWAASGTIKAPFTLSASATQYQAEISFLNPGSSGTYTQTSAGPPATWSVAGQFTIQAVIATLNEETCAKTNLCTVRARLIIDATQSEHTGSLPTPASGDTTDLVATTEVTGGIRPVVVAGSCGVTVSSAIVGQSVVINPLQLQW
jgi:hypothetical protein